MFKFISDYLDRRVCDNYAKACLDLAQDIHDLPIGVSTSIHSNFKRFKKWEQKYMDRGFSALPISAVLLSTGITPFGDWKTGFIGRKPPRTPSMPCSDEFYNLYFSDNFQSYYSKFEYMEHRIPFV